MVPEAHGWSWSRPIEPVTEADLNLVFRQMVLRGEKATRGEHRRERKVRGMAEIRVAVLGPHPPIVGDGIFDAAASRPTRARVREGRVGARNAGEETRRIDMLVLKLVKATPPVP